MNTKILFTAFLCILICASYAQTSETNCSDTKEVFDEIPIKEANTGDKDLNELIYKRNLIKYFRAAYNMPSFVNTGDLEANKKAFNMDIKLWYQQYPNFVDILELREYEQFRKFDASCYQAAPRYSKGCSASEEKAYNKRFNNWMAHHPDVPKTMGDDNASKEKHEIEKAEFYSKYYKK